MSCPITGEENCKCKYEIPPIYEVTPQNLLRKLFTDHAVYTAKYIDYQVMNPRNVSPIVDRLMINQEDIGNGLKSITDEKHVKDVIKLLKEHIKIASEIVKQLIHIDDIEREEEEGDIGEEKDILNQLIEDALDNSTKVAKGLSSINNKLSFDEVKEHFDEHNKYVVSIAKLVVKGKYEKAVKEYDCYYNHILHFADMISLLFEKE